MLREPTHGRGFLLTAVVLVAWIVLASRRPELHYHFSPLLAGLLWPLSLRSRGRRPIDDALRGGGGALVLTLAVTIGLMVGDNLNGANFLHVGPAWPEAVLFAVFGAALGVRVATRERPGLLGSVVDSTA